MHRAFLKAVFAPTGSYPRVYVPQLCVSKSFLPFQASSSLDTSSRKPLVPQCLPPSPHSGLQALLLGCDPLLGWDQGEAGAPVSRRRSLRVVRGTVIASSRLAPRGLCPLHPSPKSWAFGLLLLLPQAYKPLPEVRTTSCSPQHPWGLPCAGAQSS